MTKILSLIKLIRPQQWLKNAFVFIPMFFAGQLFNIYTWLAAIVAFFAFSFMASAVYCLNDIKDVEADRAHPRKCKRPIASGAVSVPAAWITLAVLVVCSTLLTMAVPVSGITTAVLIGAYFIMNVAYCLKLKQYAIVDVFIISVGFVMRVLAGGLACQIWLSPWIIMMTFLLALFMAFAKRRDDVLMRENGLPVTRPNTMRYNLAFLNQTMGILATITIVCYILYTVQPDVEARFHSHYIYITAVFVLAAILRYLQRAIVDDHTGSPTKILVHDRFIQACIAGWLLSFLLIIYL